VLALVAGHLVAGPSPAAAAVSLVQAQSAASNANATSISTTLPATPTRGNLLVAVAGNASSSTPLTPAGWSVAIDQTANAPGQAIFYKIAGAAESATVTISGYSSATRLGIQVYEYRGAATSAPLDRTASSSGTGTVMSSGTTATTSVANELVVAAFVINTGTTVDGWTNAFDERSDVANGGGSQSTFAGGDVAVSASGTYATTATAAASAAWRGQIATFRARRRVRVVHEARPDRHARAS
jgi:hypothetical protein